MSTLSRRRFSGLALGAAAAGLTGCRGARGARRLVVVGAGPGGLAAALEAARSGAEVVLLEGEPQVGGAARFGQAITAVPGPEGLAWWDREAGGPSPARTRYAEGVQAQVMDWLGELGVRFAETWNPHDDGATLYQPVSAGAGICLALEAAVKEAGVSLRLGSRVGRLGRSVEGLEVHLAGGEVLSADAVLLATGGFMGDLAEVRERLALPEQALLRGGPMCADGGGLELGAGLGGGLADVGEVILYAHGVAHPTHPERAVMLLGSQEGWAVGPDGQALPFLRAPRGDSGAALLAAGGTAWVVFDKDTLWRLKLWDWEERKSISGWTLAGDRKLPWGSLEDLAGQLGLPLESLQAGLRQPGDPVQTEPGALAPRPLAPGEEYGALPVLPTTAKNLGGLSTDLEGRVLQEDGAVVPGLWAVGEVCGFGRPYGGVAYDSTMVAGAVLTGRISGRLAAKG